MEQKIKDALSEAVKALYFDDDSEYGTTLWKIVEILGGQEALGMLEYDEESAYKTYVRPAK